PSVFSEPKKIRTIIIRFDRAGQPDTSASSAPQSATNIMASSVAREALPTGSQPASLAPDAQRRYPESQPSHAVEASYYAAQVASERSAADAHAVFRTLQAKFPNQLGGREPIVSRTDLGTEGIY